MEQIIWITGGGSGIGQALALHWAALGHTVIVSGRRADKLAETEHQAAGLSGHVFALACDVTDEKAVVACAAEIVKRYGRLDVCVANAGYSVYKNFEGVTPQEWHHQMDVNFFGAIWTMRAALPYLKATKGRLAVISSVSGKLASPRTSAYSASKFALVGVCNALYQELSGTGVSVTAILPGLVASDIVKVDNEGVYHADRVDKRPKRFVYPTDRAAADIARAIKKRKREAVITGHGKMGVFFVNHFSGLLYWVMRRFGTPSAR
jgi:NAD(P)-dependent dehydrogenase (short-subunit alcohol dehydrogenase family)